MQDVLAVPDAQPVPLPVVPLRDVLTWGLFAGLLSVVLLYFVGAEQGVFSGTTVHEFVHDARHLLGFPCH